MDEPHARRLCCAGVSGLTSCGDNLQGKGDDPPLGVRRQCQTQDSFATCNKHSFLKFFHPTIIKVLTIIILWLPHKNQCYFDSHISPYINMNTSMSILYLILLFHNTFN